MKHTTNMHQAKTQLSKWVQLAAQGDEVILCINGKPTAKLIGLEKNLKKRKFGIAKDQIEIANDFDQLPDSFMKYFE